MWRYIDAVDEGLALGHQTSHIYAVFYVSSFMHYVGEKLHWQGCIWTTGM